MSAATLTLQTTAQTLPFDFDGYAATVEAEKAEQARAADRELCQRYLGTWADNYGKTTKDTSISFAEFTAAAERLEAAA